MSLRSDIEKYPLNIKNSVTNSGLTRFILVYRLKNYTGQLNCISLSRVTMCIRK